ncbi:MAG TPA: hypothetical protein VK851_00670 [Anaerolineales bacterium]|nr:hypothetical protein [Anaerolineales bacterium]
MKPDLAPVIYSFIIRFVMEDMPQAEEEQPVYHGAIRHIQSAEEIYFSEWGEAVAFMQRFVPIDVSDNPKPQP